MYKYFLAKRKNDKEYTRNVLSCIVLSESEKMGKSKVECDGKMLLIDNEDLFDSEIKALSYHSQNLTEILLKIESFYEEIKEYKELVERDIYNMKDTETPFLDMIFKGDMP